MADQNDFQKGVSALQQQSNQIQQLQNELAATNAVVAEPYVVTDAESGQALPVDNEEDLSLAIVSGKYRPSKSEMFNVITPEGRRGTVDSDNIQKVLSSGQARLETAEESLLADDQEKYGDKDVQAAGLGAARAATFGLSDVFLKGGGFYKGDELRGIESANPVSSVIGEVGGVLGQAALSGGTSTAAKAASATFRASEALGAKAAAAATKQMIKLGVQKSAANSIAKRLIATSMPEVANLAAQGSLQGVGRLITEDTFGTAELNAENVLAYAGLGALVGGAFGGVIGTGKALAPSAKNLLEKGVSAFEKPKIFDRQEAALNLADLSPSAIVKAEQKMPEFKAELANAVEDVLAKEKPKSRTAFHEAFAAEREVVGKKLGDLYKSVDDKMAKALNEADTVALGTLESVNSANVSSNVMKAVDDHIEKLGISSTAEQVAALRKYGTDYAEKLGKALETKGVSATSLQDIIKDMSAKIYPPKAGGAPVTLTAAEDSLKQLQRSIRESLRRDQLAIIRNAEKLTGESLVDMQKALNKRFSVLAEVSFNSLKRAEQADGGVLDTLLDFQITSPFRIVKKALDSYPVQRMAVMQSLSKGLNHSNTAIDSAVNGIWKAAKVAGKTAASATTATAQAAVPVAMRHLTSYELSKKIVDGKKVKAANEDEAYANIMENASRSLTDPESVLKESNRNTASMFEHAPNTAGAIDAKYLQMLQYIASKNKKNGKKTGLFDSMKVEKVSEFEKARLNRYLEAMEDPVGVLKKAQSGKLSREHVDVIKNLFPEIHKKVKDVTLTKLSKSGGNLTYQQKLQVGLLLDLTPHESMNPENIRGLQSTFETEPEPNQQEVNLDSFERSETMKTETQTHTIGE